MGQPTCILEQLIHRFGLLIADFHQDQAVGNEVQGGIFSEALIKLQTGWSCEEGTVGFKVGQLRSQRLLVADIGRVRDDDVKSSRLESRESVGEGEGNIGTEGFGIFLSDRKRLWRDIAGDDLEAWIFEFEGDGDAPGSGAQIEDFHVFLGEQRDSCKSGLDEDFSFLARDKDAGADTEGATLEFTSAEDVGEGFMGKTSHEDRFTRQVREWFFGVSKKPRSGDKQHVSGEELSFQPR